MAKPAVYDPHEFVRAGIDPKTRLPLKLGSSDPSDLEIGMKKIIRIIDEQDAVNRYRWYNIPTNLTSQELERMLYYRGQLCFFYNKDTEEFYFMPYALEGTIDFYGRFNSVHPVPMTSGTTEEDKKRVKAQADYLSTLKLKCVYGIMTEEPDTEDLENSCVLLHDYTKQLSQTIIPRVEVNEPLIANMAEILPMARTSMLLGTGVNGVKVLDADQALSVKEGAKGMERAAKKGDPWIPITASLDFTDLAPSPIQKTEEYMLHLQSLDNFRLSTYGLENGGLFEKKAHMLEQEASVTNANVGLIYQDGLSIRQHFCDVVNSIWGLGIWCDASETVLGTDVDGDGLAYDENDEEETDGVEVEADGE